MSLSNLVKSIQNIMRQDAGVDGDAQRISQLGWMFFLKIFDDKEEEKKRKKPEIEVSDPAQNIHPTIFDSIEPQNPRAYG